MYKQQLQYSNNETFSYPQKISFGIYPKSCT